MAILATANINGLGLPAAMGGSGCSALKGSGSNQDPKRTEGSSGLASDDSTQSLTPFQESLHSTIKNQESIHQQHQNTGAAEKKSNNNKAGNQRQLPLNVSSTCRQPAAAKSDSGRAAKSDATQNQQPPEAGQNASTSADPNTAVVASDATLTDLVAVLQFGGSTVSVPTTADSSTVSTAAADSTSGAISGAAAASPVNLDSQIRNLKGDQDSLVFDGTLHPAAPAPTSQPQIALAGAGKPAWLLNAQPVYTAGGSTNQTAGLPEQSYRAANTPVQTGIPQPLPASSTPVNASSDGNQAPPAKIAAGTGQSIDSLVANINQQKPAPDSAPENPVATIPAEQSGQASSGQSSSSNSSDLEKDAKHSAATPDATHLPENAAVNGSQIFPTSDSGTNGIGTTDQPNNAAAASSKSSTLPIDQQADTRQPSMKTDLNMRIQGQSGESINLRISERAGDIQISVRSSDQTTANVLKHELPSIEAGLERAGWHVENGGMSQSGQEQREAGRDSQNPDKNRDQNPQSPNWQDRNQRRKDASPDTWFEVDQ